MTIYDLFFYIIYTFLASICEPYCIQNRLMCIVQANFDSSNINGSFTVANSNPFFWVPKKFFRLLKKTNI